MSPVALEATLTEITSQHIYTVRGPVRQEDLGQALATRLREVWDCLQQDGVSIVGAPIARYHVFGIEPMDISIGLPVLFEVAPTGRMQTEVLPGGRAALAVHRGPYDQLHDTYDAFFTWIGRQGMKASGPHWDRFVIGPAQSSDASAWQTDIFVPLRD